MKKAYLLFLLFSTITVKAQVWIGTVPTYYNPSFAGNTGGQRISIYGDGGVAKTERLNRTNINPNLAYDVFIHKISTGLAIAINHNYSYSPNNSLLKKTGGTISIAPKLSFRGKYTFSPSISYAYHEDYYMPYFINYIDLLPSGYNLPIYNKMETNTNRITSGFLFNTNKFYAGITINIYTIVKGKMGQSLATRNYSRTDNPYLSTLQLGYTFQRAEKSNFSFTPQLVVGFFEMDYQNDKMRNRIRSRKLDLNFRYQNFLFGIGSGGPYGNDVMVGYQKNKVKIMYIHQNLFDDSSSGTSTVFNFYGALSLRIILKKEDDLIKSHDTKTH